MHILLTRSLQSSTGKDSRSSYTVPSAPDGNLTTHALLAEEHVMDSRGEARAEETIYNSFSSTEVSHGDHMVSIPTEESRKETSKGEMFLLVIRKGC